jgi:DNA-binding NtrC family response regulator
MAPLNYIKILLVEDDAVQAQLLKEKLLEMVSLTSIEIFDQSESLLAYLDNGISAQRTYYLICDHFLQSQKHPDTLNGLDLIKLIKQQYPSINIILFSAFESDENVEFKKMKDEFHLLDYVKKSPHGFSSIINIIRFDYSKKSLQKRAKRLKMAIGVAIACMIIVIVQIIYFLL